MSVCVVKKGKVLKMVYLGFKKSFQLFFIQFNIYGLKNASLVIKQSKIKIH